MVERVKLENKIESFAYQTRLIILFFQVIFNAIIPDHDAGVFNPPISPGHNNSLLDDAVILSVGGLRRWDAVYIMHVAEYGYTYENTAAFLPLYPVVVGKVADGLYCFSPAGLLMSKLNICMMISVALNIFFFSKAASTLYHLGVKVLNDEALAYKAALLFCINPASIFMTAPYTEALFAYLTLKGLLAFASGRTYWSSILFGLSSLTRANGIISAGFILYRCAKSFMNNMARLSQTKFQTMFERLMVTSSIIWLYMVPGLTGLALCVAPFLLYQWYIYRLFCSSTKLDVPYHIEEYGHAQGYKLPGETPSPWCTQLLPLSYSYIQQNHWGVGFLQYYQFKQIPNFLLAAPMVVLSLCACIFYYQQNKVVCLRLGMVEEGEVDKKTDRKGNHGFKNVRLFVYVAHLLCLTVFGIFFIHIQVLTRLLASSSPVVYWFAAKLMTKESFFHRDLTNKYDIFSTRRLPQIETAANMRSVEKGNLLIDQISDFWKQDTNTKLVLAYFIFFFVVGTAAFSNFLPWT